MISTSGIDVCVAYECINGESEVLYSTHHVLKSIVQFGAKGRSSLCYTEIVIRIELKRRMQRGVQNAAIACARGYLRRLGVRQMCSASPKQASTSSAVEKNTDVRGPMTWRVVALCGLLGSGGLALYSRERERQIAAVTRPRTVGKAAIGGAFELQDARGARFTEQRLLGKWSLIYFGFCMCPDICPAEMTKVADALSTLERRGLRVGHEEGCRVAPIFITVDAERDDAERADEYAKAFHKGFVGLAGTEAQVRHTAKQYRVYYSRDDGEGDEYLVDHSIITYLMDPNGEFVEFYGKNSSAAEMAARVEGRMLAWKA